MKEFPELVINNQITTDANGEYDYYASPTNALDYSTYVVTNALSASSGNFGSIITDVGHGLVAADLDKTIIVWHTSNNICVAKLMRIVDDDNFEISESLGGTPGSAVLYVVFSTSTTTNGYLKALIGAYNNTDDVNIKVIPSDLYLLVKNGVNTQYVPSATNLFAFQLANYFKFLPAASFNAKTIDITYIRQPLQNDGTLITQGGAQDSPFRRHHNSAIAAIGEDLIRIDFQYAR